MFKIICFYITLLTSSVFALSSTDDLIERYGKMSKFDELMNLYDGTMGIDELIEMYSEPTNIHDLIEVRDKRINAVTARIEFWKNENLISTCSGVLIEKKKVLSAAHCLSEGADIYVIIGKGLDAQYIAVESIITMDMPKQTLVYPNRSLTFFDILAYGESDVVILNLSKESKSVPLKIKPLRESEIITKNLIVAGFPGRSESLREESIYPGVTIAKNVTSTGYCYFFRGFRYGFDEVLATNCVTTSGNSGGPLFTYIGDQLHLVGISSLSEWDEVTSDGERIFGESNTKSYFVNVHSPKVQKWLRFHTSRR